MRSLRSRCGRQGGNMDFSRWLRTEWDRILGFGLIGLGAVFVVLAYFGVSDSPYLAQQLSFITSGGIGGLFLLGAGATLLHTADVHDGGRKLDGIERALRAGEPPTWGAPRPGAPQVVGSPARRAHHLGGSAPQEPPDFNNPDAWGVLGGRSPPSG